MRTILCTFLLLGASIPTTASAQTVRSSSHEVDLTLGYNVQRSNSTMGTSFWQQGGMLELSAEVYRGFGAAMLISGGHANNLSSTGINLDTVTTTFGPRYTFSHKKIAVFGEGLIGEANGFNSVFPSRDGVLSRSNSFALQTGGGIDLRLSQHVAVRPLQASWLRTEFQNATTNVQNSLQLGAGVVFRLQR